MFCKKFSDISEKYRQENKTNNQTTTKRYALQINAKLWGTIAYQLQGRKQT